MKERVVCIDFDGVIHTLENWRADDDIANINGRLIPGALEFFERLIAAGFTPAIYSARSKDAGARRAMQRWLERQFRHHYFDAAMAEAIMQKIEWPQYKPVAIIYLDDRAMHFDGKQWPSVESIIEFRAWWQR